MNAPHPASTLTPAASYHDGEDIYDDVRPEYKPKSEMSRAAAPPRLHARQQGKDLLVRLVLNVVCAGPLLTRHCLSLFVSPSPSACTSACTSASFCSNVSPSACPSTSDDASRSSGLFPACGSK